MGRFHTEPTGYEKGAWSDLQGAWSNLREAIVACGPFPEVERLLFHIDEATSWECVREPEYMRKSLLLVRNIAAQAKVPAEVLEWIEMVEGNLSETMDAIKEGKAK